MGSGISGSTSSRVSQTTTPDSTTATSEIQTSSQAPAEAPKKQEDSQATVKTQQGSKQHATEQKGESSLRGNLTREQLEAQITKGGNGKIDPNLMKDTATVQAAPEKDNRTLQERVKVAGDGSGTPPPTTIKEYAYDKVADKVAGAIKDLKVDLKNDVHPKLSPEQEALHDVAAGMKNYQAYMSYAQNAAAILKVAPNNTKVKEALTKHLGNMDDLSKKLETAASTLGKVGKYADLAKDALGTTKAVREMIQNTPKDFSDRKAVEQWAGSVKNTKDHAQAWVERGKDALTAAGKAGGAVALSYIAGVVSIGVDGLDAGVKNVNKYIDRMEKNMKLIENGGVNPAEIKIPDPPPPVKTYKELQLDEHLEKRSKVYQAVDNQFHDARDGVKKAFQARHKEVHNKFDKEILPNLYMGNRNEIMKQLREEVKLYSSDRHLPEGVTPEEGRKRLLNTKALLTSMEQRTNRPGAAQIQEEISALQSHYGGPQPLPVDKLLKNYQPERDKYYDKHGLGEGMLTQEYIRHGLTDGAKDKLYNQKIIELGLDTLPWEN